MSGQIRQPDSLASVNLNSFQRWVKFTHAAPGPERPDARSPCDYSLELFHIVQMCVRTILFAVLRIVSEEGITVIKHQLWCLLALYPRDTFPQ